MLDCKHRHIATHGHRLFVLDETSGATAHVIDFQVHTDEDHREVIDFILARHRLHTQDHVWTDDGHHYATYLEED